MNTRRIPITVVIAVCTLLALPVMAAAQPAGPGSTPGAAGRPGGQGQRARVRERIRALRAQRLIDALDLDEAGAARLFPVLRRFDQRFAALDRQASTVRAELTSLSGRAGASAQVNKAIDSLEKLRKQRFDLENERFAAVRKVLTPEQAARALLVLPTLDRKIRRSLRRAVADKSGLKDPFARPRKRMRRPNRRPRPDRGDLKNPFGDPTPTTPRPPRSRPDQSLDPFSD